MSRHSQAQTRSANYCRFYLVRHGQTVWNTQYRIQGHKDSPLTKNGLSQAKNLSQTLKNIKFDYAFSSDLLRAQKTAEIIAANRDLAIKTTKLLREVSMGRFEGKTIAYFQNQLKAAIDYRESLSEKQKMNYKIHPDIESYAEVATRMITFLRQTAVAYPGKNVLVVSHAYIIRATLIKLGFATNNQLPHGSINNTSRVIIDCDGIDFFIRETVGINKKTE